MKQRVVTGSCVMVIAIAGAIGGESDAFGDSSGGEFALPTGDAVARRTDSWNSGALLPDQMLPDLTNISVQPWIAADPANDPYTGSVASQSTAALVRVQLTVDGLVNPPSTVGIGSAPFDPMLYGKSPIYGFIEFDVDDDKDTGGEWASTAALRPLGQASRFGGRFYGSIGDRQARSASDLNQPWNVEPEVSRSGADWVLSLCGCFPINVEFKSDPYATCFGPGQTWIVSGRFFQRAGGYRSASLMTGGTSLGAYDPIVNLRFKHDTATNKTTITLVYPLTQAGAALLSGGAAEAVNKSASDHTSIEEGVADLVTSSTRPGLTGLTRALISDWDASHANDALDPRRWEVRALIGTAYPNIEDSPYVWTDAGPKLQRRDVDGSGTCTTQDRAKIIAERDALDGGPDDGDGVVNQKVQIVGFGSNFSLYDVNGDGWIDDLDLGGFPLCAADFNGSGAVSVQDVFDFLIAWFTGAADFNGNGSTSVQDLFDFLSAWFAGC